MTVDLPSVTRSGFVACITLRRPPNNFVDSDTIEALAAGLEALDADASCRAVVIRSEGKHFCAGANLVARMAGAAPRGHIYEQAARLVRTRKPIVAAIQGAAVGAGLGLAMVADFRVAANSARFSANFTMQGYHPGFGLTLTLPETIGQQHAARLLLTGARIKGDEALRIGLVDRLVADEALHDSAMVLANELAAAGPLGVQATRRTLRAGFAERFEQVIAVERAAQDVLVGTADYREGVLAMNERRTPHFKGL